MAISSNIKSSLGSYGHLPGEIYADLSAGKTYVNNGDSWISAVPYQPSPEELAKRDEYLREKELEDAKHKEKIEALKTLFPRGYAVIPNLDIMLDIAREDQLNPLYEQVLKEFEDAQSALHRATNKLASAVKLTDSETVEERAKKSAMDGYAAKMGLNGVYGKAAYNGPMPTYANTTLGGIGANLTGAAAPGNMGVMGAVGPVGAPGMTGMTGPKGDKGDPGVDGKDAVIDEGLIMRLIRKVLGERK